MKFVRVSAFLMLLLSQALSANIEDPLSVFTSATETLKDGDSEAAADRYEELVKADWHSPELYHNLGVAYQRQGDTQTALLQLYRAWLLKPFSSTAKSLFLSQAKEARLSKAQMSQAETQAAALAWRTPLALSALILFWASVILVILAEKPVLRGFGFAGVAIGLLLSAAAYYFHQAAPTANTAWVISQEAESLRASHGSGSPQLTTALPLTQVDIRNQRDQWAYVQRDNGSGGWIKEGSVGKLMPWR